VAWLCGESDGPGKEGEISGHSPDENMFKWDRGGERSGCREERSGCSGERSGCRRAGERLPDDIRVVVEEGGANSEVGGA